MHADLSIDLSSSFSIDGVVPRVVAGGF